MVGSRWVDEHLGVILSVLTKRCHVLIFLEGKKETIEKMIDIIFLKKCSNHTAQTAFAI